MSRGRDVSRGRDGLRSASRPAAAYLCRGTHRQSRRCWHSRRGTHRQSRCCCHSRRDSRHRWSCRRRCDNHRQSRCRDNHRQSRCRCRRPDIRRRWSCYRRDSRRRWSRRCWHSRPDSRRRWSCHRDIRRSTCLSRARRRFDSAGRFDLRRPVAGARRNHALVDRRCRVCRSGRCARPLGPWRSQSNLLE